MNQYQHKQRRRPNAVDNSGIADIVQHRKDPYFSKEFARENQENKIQTITKESLTDDFDANTKYCSDCASPMYYFQKDKVFSCNKCGLKVEDIKDVPIPAADLLLKEPTNEIGISAAQNPMEDGKDFFFESFSPEDNNESPNVELVSSSFDNRIQHIRVKGDITKALSAQHTYE